MGHTDHGKGIPDHHEHRQLGTGGLRAAVFGFSDGLTSNLALILGVATGTSAAGMVELAGIAGLLAGAVSMAAGEWISMQAQREALQRELGIEQEHLARYPDEEREHFTSILREAGLSEETTAAVMRELADDPKMNLDFHARFELGIDPGELGSPRLAALSSFIAFAGGAFIPLMPWLFGSTGSPRLVTILISAACLFGVGSLLSLYTRRLWYLSGLRQLGVGAAAAAATMLIGSMFVQ